MILRHFVRGGSGGIVRTKKINRKLQAAAGATAIECLENRTLLSGSIISTGTGGNWNNPATWVGGVVPGNSVDVTIAAGATVTVSDNEGANTLTTQTGSTLTVSKTDSSHEGILQIILGAGSAVNGNLNVAGEIDGPQTGTVNLTGTTVLSGRFFGGTYDNKATMSINDGDINGAFVFNDATLNINGGIAIGNANLTNNSTGTVNIPDDAGVTYDSFMPAGNNTITNMGTWNKTGGTGTYVIPEQFFFNNIGGTFNLNSGNVSVVGNIAMQDGTFSIASGSIFSIDTTAPGQNKIAGTVTGTGAGTLQMNGGTFSPELFNGTDSDGTFNFPQGFAQVTGESFSSRDTNQIFNTGFLNFVGSAAHGAMTMDNQGTITNSGTASLAPNQFTNDTTGIVDLQNDTAMAGASFVNLGILRKSAGTGTTDISVSFTQQGGTIDVKSGTISLQDPAPTYIAGSALTVVPGSVLDIHGTNNVNLSGTLTATGGGTVTFTSGSISGAVAFDSSHGMLPGILNFPANTFFDEGGILNNGNTGLTNTGIINYQGANTVDSITNQGTIFVDAGPFTFNSNPFINDTAGVLNFIADTSVLGSATFQNKGTIIKSAGTGMVSLAVLGSLVNTGTIEAGSGTLQLSSTDQGLFGFTPQSEKQVNAGETFKVDAGASITLDQPQNPFHLTTNAGTILLNGAGATFPALSTLDENDGTLSVLSGAALTTGAALNNTGTFNVGGNVTVAGSFTQASSGTLNYVISGAPSSAGAPVLAVQGSSMLAGTLSASDTGFTVTAGSSYTVATFSGAQSGSFSSTSVGPDFTATVNASSIVLNASGGGGGGNTPTVVPVTGKSTVPTAVVVGAKARGSVLVTLTNATASTIKGAGTLKLFASTNGSVDESSILVASVPTHLNLKAGKSANVHLAVKSLPASLTAGTYTLLTESASPSGVVNDATTGPTLVVAAPFVQLSDAIGSVSPRTLKPGKGGSIAITVTNSGNIATTGAAVFNIGVSVDGQTELTTFVNSSRNLSIKSGKHKTIRVHFVVPVSQTAATYASFISVTQDGSTTSAIGQASLVVS